MAQSVQIKAVRPWHEELLEFIIANPRASGAEIALYFNVTESWVSIVKNSDAFKELWAARRSEHFSRVSAGLSDKVTALAEVTIDTLADEVEKKKRNGELKIQELKEIGEMALKSLGFGAKREASLTPVVVNNNNFVVDKDTLANARAAKAKLIDSEARPEPKFIEVSKEKERASDV